MSRRVLCVIGSRTREDGYGVTSGHRVAVALRRQGCIVDIIHAAEGPAILRRLLDRPPDVVMPVGFGAPCEDGHVFAACRLAGVPCAGPTPAAGGLMQDKAMLSHVVDSLFAVSARVRSPRGCVLPRGISDAEAWARVQPLTAPFVIKPAYSGSSDGLDVCQTHSAALAAARAILNYEGKVLIQELERPILAEISCTVLDDIDGAHFLPIVQLRRDKELVIGAAEKFGSEGLDRHVIPARIDTQLTARVEHAVLAIHDAVGAVGLTRTDILLRDDGEIVVLELNGIPGLLESSIACDAARAAGISFDQLCSRLLDSAYIERPEPKIWGATS